jgi:hypothetical protein
VVVTIGSLLHFAWAWSGRSSIVAIFAATNESTWEHLKMAFWPAFLLSPIQRRFYGKLPGWLPATAIRSLLPPVLIVVFFYGYTSVLGTNHLAIDVATFIVAVFIGELLGHSVMPRRTAALVRVAAAAALMIAVVAFSTLSFIRPEWFLFEDPLGGAHGVPVAEPAHPNR